MIFFRKTKITQIHFRKNLLKMSLNELLDSFGFASWKTITASIILPILNLVGFIFCAQSTFIFFQRKFKDPIFVYYRILFMVYCLSCLHNFPEGVLFSPRYFPDMNTYASTVYQIYYAFMGNLLFHFQECLQISVLLMRMSIFSKILEKHFKPLSPMYVSLTLFVVCLLINIENCSTRRVCNNWE